MKPENLFRTLLFLSAFSVLLSSCEGECDPSERTGAICNDGTTSAATGSGACSNHGGVDEWICP